MNNVFKSTALGLVLAALTVGAGAETAPELGCSASTYRDAPAPGESIDADGSRYWQGNALRVGGTENFNGVRVIKTNDIGASKAAASGSAALERISSRVERLGQGIAATPLVRGLIYDTRNNSDSTGEPKLPMLLLAAAGVVAFVARRRRVS